MSDEAQSSVFLAIGHVQHTSKLEVGKGEVLLSRVRAPAKGKPCAVDLRLAVSEPQRSHVLVAVPAIVTCGGQGW